MLRSISVGCAVLLGIACLGQYASASDPDYYPDDALRHGEEGETIVKVCVAKGKIASVTLVSSSGHKELDRAAMANMRTKELRDHFLSHPPAGADPSGWCKDIKTTYSAHPRQPNDPPKS